MRFLKRAVIVFIVITIIIVGSIFIDSLREKSGSGRSAPEFSLGATKDEPFVVDWPALIDRNSDTVGYLIIDGTEIHTPVVQTDNNEDYLWQDFDRNEGLGTPFLDTAHHDKSQNAVIYGHSNSQGDRQFIFDELHGFVDQDYLERHRIIRYDRPTDKKSGTNWEVFAVIVVDKDFDYRRPDFAVKEDFEAYYRAIKEKSMIASGTQAVYGDEILTLSTCFEPSPNGRIAVIAKRLP